MSTQYPGGFITKTPVVPSGGFETSTASGIWTVDQALQYVKAGNWPTQGVVPLYIENVFSTYLYTGTGATKNINNGINLSANGGLVWSKQRNGASGHFLFDTVRGVNNGIVTSNTTAQTVYANSVSAFNTNGFRLGDNGNTNNNLSTYVGWTFREQAKFFDIVTYTGTGSARAVSHNLGSVPGCMIIKSTTLAGTNWLVYHQSTGNTKGINLNNTDPTGTVASYWNNTSPTSTQFTVGSSVNTNEPGETYVAYLFASNAGGFGLTLADNAITCGTYTGGGASAVNINLGYEAQWLLVRDTAGGNWYMFDNMRSFPNPSSSDARALKTESAAAETLESAGIFTATGFSATSSTTINGNASVYIYIAIRRGPMKIPTQATDVFAIQPRTGTGTETTVSGNPAIDFLLTKSRSRADANLFAARLTGMNQLSASNTNAQTTSSASLFNYPWTVENNDGVIVGSGSAGSLTNVNAATYINYLFRRAPSFFDVVCYTGTGAVRTLNHNLGVAPELMIIKSRSNSGTNYRWPVYAAPRGASQGAYLDAVDEFAPGYGTPFWNDTAPTASVFTLGTTQQLNGSGATYVAYLFASLAGVTKVGSYTGTAALQTINCGFTYGAAFVLIKRADVSGDWYVYDYIRGMTSGTDPYFLMNTAAAEVTGTNYVDTDTTGFKITAAAPAALNASGGTYIFYAISV
jgi:hypothetical protein